MDLTPQGTDTCLPTSQADVSGTDHRTDGFRERCCYGDGSVRGGRYFANQPRHLQQYSIRFNPNINS